MATHLAEQARKRHEDYLAAEVASLREQLRLNEDKIRSLMGRLAHVERNLGWPGE